MAFLSPWALVLLAALLPAGPDGQAAAPGGGKPAPPNLLILTFDTTRADHLSAYGGGAEVPNLDRLAREGTRFDRAFAAAPMTLPSHASLFTGLYPIAHGVLDNASFRLSEEAVTLAERLRDRGYRTGAVTGSRVLDSRYGLAQGFETYDDRMPPEETTRTLHLERPAAEVAQAGLGWLAAGDGGPWFLWLHFFDPHWEYDPPEPFRTRYEDAPYDGEIAYADSQAGRVLDFLRERGSLDRTVVVATSDHGESLGEHGEDTHGVFVYDATVRVPLLLRYPPAVGAGKRVSAMASLVDVVPTVLALLDVPFDADGLQGTDLLRPRRHGPAASPDTVWMESWGPRYRYGWSQLVAIRDGDWKFIQAPRPELYHLGKDPGETNNLVKAEPDRAARYVKRLTGLAAALAPQGGALATAETPDPDELKALAALGYISLGTSPDGGDLPDPKDRIGEIDAIMDAMQMISREQWEPAVPALQDLTGRNPRSAFLRHHLGNALVGMGRVEAGIRELYRSLELDPESFTVRDDLGTVLFRDGQPERAEAEFRETLRRNPNVAIAWHNLGLIEQTRKRPAEAIRLYERALQEDPNLLRSIINLGTLREEAGETDRALEMYLRAAELNPANELTFFSAAFVLFESGRFDEALDVLRRASEAHPDSPRPALYRARVYQKMGDLDAAERELRAALTLDPSSAEARRMLAALERLRDGGER